MFLFSSSGISYGICSCRECMYDDYRHHCPAATIMLLEEAFIDLMKRNEENVCQLVFSTSSALLGEIFCIKQMKPSKSLF